MKITLRDEEGVFDLGARTRLSTALLPLGETSIAESHFVGEVARLRRSLPCSHSGSAIVFDKVLMLGDGDKVSVG